MSRKRRKHEALFLLGSADAAAVLRHRLESREWWCFVIVNFIGLPFVEHLERRHYSGKASRDFEMLGFPFVAGLGAVGICLGHKRRLSTRDLSRQLDAAGMVREAETLAKNGNDIIVFTHSAEALEHVQNWMTQLVKGQPGTPARTG